MTDGERLAAYLVGELGPAERREFEARLEHDPELRARLDAIRRTDEALASLPPTAPDPAFSERLRHTLRAELAPPPSAEETTDELAARRERRRSAPAWLAPLGAAAAGLAVLAVVGVGLGNLGSSDEGDVAATDEVEQGETAAAEMAPDELVDGPVVVALNRSYDGDDITSILTDPAVEAVTGMPSDDAADTADRYLSAFGSIETSEDAPLSAEQAGDDGAEADAGTMTASRATLNVRGEADEDAFADVQRCLPQLFEEAGLLIPVYAELATFEGESAIVYALVAEDRDTRDFSQVEIWAVSRDTCDVLFFTQT